MSSFSSSIRTVLELLRNLRRHSSKRACEIDRFNKARLFIFALKSEIKSFGQKQRHSATHLRQNTPQDLRHHQCPAFIQLLPTSFSNYRPPSSSLLHFYFVILLMLCRKWCCCHSQIDDEKLARQKAIDEWLPITSSRNAKWWYSAFHNITVLSLLLAACPQKEKMIETCF
ncbi:hypothetical protein Pint_26705 [Pistacia integerrima]|uniref:Uncharacterized protein n=1 Tax=Pistacia integerrima TaxID=434235 RepID=A0ACC0YRU2_9ROSI|nr:hypothetical protein Pint_26705 [Pistacia integerrima]